MNIITLNEELVRQKFKTSIRNELTLHGANVTNSQ